MVKKIKIKKRGNLLVENWLTDDEVADGEVVVMDDSVFVDDDDELTTASFSCK